MQLKILRRAIFFGASENENVGGFPLKRDGWKDLIIEEVVAQLQKISTYF
ncbi:MULTISPECIES: hypothetical protein [Okeania]|nr:MULTISPECIES: hypothetical protein [Okeania]NES93207.1 hypothetical protein [Okeania sp. SIO2B9]